MFLELSSNSLLTCHLYTDEAYEVNNEEDAPTILRCSCSQGDDGEIKEVEVVPKPRNKEGTQLYLLYSIPVKLCSQEDASICNSHQTYVMWFWGENGREAPPSAVALPSVVAANTAKKSILMLS
ncbi:hypothetical protein AgCh_002748 [Apium graveolens]